MALVDTIFGNGIQVEGNCQVQGTVLLGLSNTAGTDRTIQAQGSGADINIVLTPKGTGIVSTTAPVFISSSGTITANTKVDIRGVSGGTVLRLAKHDNNSILSVANDTGAITFGNSGFVKLGNTNNGTTYDVTGNALLFTFTNSTFNLPLLGLIVAGNMTSASGSYVILGNVTDTALSFAPSSGTATFTYLSIVPKYNTTGSYVGTAYGIDYNPTLTSVTGLTHYAIRTTSGQVLLANSSSDTITATTRLDVRGISSGTILRLAKSTNETVLTVVESQTTAVNGILVAGYTGSAQTVGIKVENHAAGTGNGDPIANVFSNNQGFLAFADATTVGTNIGGFGYARKGNLNYGLFGAADDTKTNATNVGVGGHATPPGGTDKQVGGFFRVTTASPTAATYASTALLADNGNTTLPVFIGQVAGVNKFTLTPTSTSLSLLLNTTSNNAIIYGVQPALTTSGGKPILILDGGAHTALTASTELRDITINLARTVEFATGALTTQRAVRIQAPTYAFVGASTLTDAATFAISGAPIAGTNATITNSYALWVEAGASRFAGSIFLGSVTQDDAKTRILGIDNTTGQVFWRDASTLGGGGGSPGGGDNEIQKKTAGASTFSGTKIFSSTDGNIVLGDSGLSGANRVVTATGSATDVGLTFLTKGAGNVTFFNAGGLTGFMKIGKSFGGPDRILEVGDEDAANSAVSYFLRLSHSATGTIAAGMGVGMEFNCETGGGMQVGGTIEVVATDVTSSSQDFDFVVKLMTAGAAAAEKFRITATGDIGIGGSSFGGGVKVIFIPNATTVPGSNPTGGGVLYCEAGALKYRGSSGTVTVLANA